jgi:uncharacterized protein YprB with RNaseH-like and TPR domain
MITIATFDIETTHLSADFGVVLCAVIKASTPPDSKPTKPVVLRQDDLNADWNTCRSNDRELIRATCDELDKYDVLIAHNGLRFDLPFLRTRAAKWGLQPLKEWKIVDPVQLARNKFKFAYNSLDRIAEFLGVNSKTEVTGDMWLKAALDGDRKAMNYICKHCVEDVFTLERIVDAVKGYSSAFNAWGSGK